MSIVITIHVHFQNLFIQNMSQTMGNYQLDALTNTYLFVKYYSPLHVSSIKCSSSGAHSCVQAAYGTVTLYKSPGGLLIRSYGCLSTGHQELL